MTRIFFFLLPALILMLPSCHDEASSATVLGKWSVVYDSQYVGVGSNNHLVTYTAKAGDYFDFRSDNQLYTREGLILDTLSYSLNPFGGIVISTFGAEINGVPPTSQFTQLTPFSAIIRSPHDLTPGGQFGRTVRLAR